MRLSSRIGGGEREDSATGSRGVTPGEPRRGAGLSAPFLCQNDAKCIDAKNTQELRPALHRLTERCESGGQSSDEPLSVEAGLGVGVKIRTIAARRAIDQAPEK